MCWTLPYSGCVRAQWLLVHDTLVDLIGIGPRVRLQDLVTTYSYLLDEQRDRCEAVGTAIHTDGRMRRGHTGSRQEVLHPQSEEQVLHKACTRYTGGANRPQTSPELPQWNPLESSVTPMSF